jgi:FAD/FMN-containing dehydrogenase
VRVVLPDDATQRTAIDALNRFEGVRVPERMPAAVWHAGKFAPVADDRLSRGARDRFDPQRVLNPGILGESS